MSVNVSIIIRTKNEEDWIAHCLSSVFNQDYKNFEVIIVDNSSTDKTLKIAKQFSIANIVEIDEYLPGKAINAGINVSNGDIIVILSAHCIPKKSNWLRKMIVNLDNSNIAGVYGRQVPTTFSRDCDVRDLYITFGRDKRIQVKDYFFHNANSAIKRAIWNEIPFDEFATNIEDRIWAKAVTEAGYKLVYEPEAEVFHSHGIHQNQNRNRVNSVIKILKDVENFDSHDLLPKTLKPSERNIIALIPIKEPLKKIGEIDPILSLIDHTLSIPEINETILIANNELLNKVKPKKRIKFIERMKWCNDSDVSLGNVLKWGLEKVNNNGNFPDYIFYLNPDYLFRPENLLKKMIYDACYKGLDTVFVGYAEYANYWIFDNRKGDYAPFGENLLPRVKKHPIIKSLFGSGCITRSRIVRKGKLIGDSKIGVIFTDDIKHTLRLSDPNTYSLIEKLLV